MNSDQLHLQNRQDAIEQLVRDYGFEEILEGLTDYAHTQAIATADQMSEYWYDLVESLQHIQDGWETKSSQKKKNFCLQDFL